MLRLAPSARMLAVLPFALLLSCGSDDFPTGSSANEPFATTPELQGTLPGVYLKAIGNGSLDHWTFNLDGTFERRMSWTGGTSSRTSRWVLEDDGVVYVERFTYGTTLSRDGVNQSRQDEQGPAWIRVRRSGEATSFFTVGDSRHQISFIDYERFP